MNRTLLMVCAVSISSLMVMGCEQKTTEIDYQKLAQAIGEEIVKANTKTASASATATATAAATSDFDQPLALNEIEYLIDDRFFLRNVPLGKSLRIGFNFPICLAVNRSGGMLMYKDPFENHACIDAMADWWRKNPSIVVNANSDSVFSDMGYQRDERGLPVPKLTRK